MGRAPMGIISGSTTMSWAGMPKSAARSTIFLATAKRISGSIEMPVSSLEMATTGTLYFLTSGRTSSSRSSSPVTEFSSGRPSQAWRPASSAPGTLESMQSGMSTRPWIISIMRRMSGGSVSLGFGFEL